MFDDRMRSMRDLATVVARGSSDNTRLPPDLLARLVALENMFDPSYQTRLVAVEDNLRQINVSTKNQRFCSKEQK